LGGEKAAVLRRKTQHGAISFEGSKKEKGQKKPVPLMALTDERGKRNNAEAYKVCKRNFATKPERVTQTGREKPKWESNSFLNQKRGGRGVNDQDMTWGGCLEKQNRKGKFLP